LLENLRHFLFQEPLEEWIPQDEFLGLIGTGNNHAIASKGGIALEGEYLWKLKQKIDINWMKGYQELPTMEEMEETAAKRKKEQDQQPQQQAAVVSSSLRSIAELKEPDIIALLNKSKMRFVSMFVCFVLSSHLLLLLFFVLLLSKIHFFFLSLAYCVFNRCAGCGSKVGSSVITRAFKRLKLLEKQQHQKRRLHQQSSTSTSYRPEIIAGIGDDAAIMRFPSSVASSVSPLLVQTIDYFRSFVSDPYLFGQITAYHALSDVFAMNGEAVSAMALCILPYGTEQKVRERESRFYFCCI
jgi:selenide,water dikinase